MWPKNLETRLSTQLIPTIREVDTTSLSLRSHFSACLSKNLNARVLQQQNKTRGLCLHQGRFKFKILRSYCAVSISFVLILFSVNDWRSISLGLIFTVTYKFQQQCCVLLYKIHWISFQRFNWMLYLFFLYAQVGRYIICFTQLSFFYLTKIKISVTIQVYHLLLDSYIKLRQNWLSNVGD